MGLLPGIVPRSGQIYACNFSGYVAPEIVKLRQVVIVSPSHSGAPLWIVVPVSGTEPIRQLPIHVKLPGSAVYPCFTKPEVWVKADLIAHVRFDRLDRVRVPVLDAAGNPIPRRQHYIPTVSLSPEHFRAVRQAVLHALGLGRLAPGV